MDSTIAIFVWVPFVIIAILTLLYAFWDKIEGKEYAVTSDVLAHESIEKELGRE